MLETAQLFTPPPSLSGCVFVGIVRDTRGHALGDLDRFSHFPASPLIALTLVIEGELFIVDRDFDLASMHRAQPVPSIALSGAQTRPTTSWSKGPILAVSVGFFPDAWMKLTGQSPDDLIDQINLTVPDAILNGLQSCLKKTEPDEIWQEFCKNLEELWVEGLASKSETNWPGQDRLSNWSRSLMSRVALSQTGKSLRAFERALKKFSGHNKQSLEFYARLEDLHRLSLEEQGTPLASIAQDAGFSDQSHMGRTVRRATGFSPAELNKQIASQEAFWCYRLLGERF